MITPDEWLSKFRDMCHEPPHISVKRVPTDSVMRNFIGAIQTDIEQESSTRWIPVSERLPEESDYCAVRVFLPEGGPAREVAYWNAEARGWGKPLIYDNIFDAEQITHWQKLPNLPPEDRDL